MSESTDPYTLTANIFSSWMQSVNDFWANAPASFTPPAQTVDSGETPDSKTSGTDFWKTGMETWQSIASAAEQVLSGGALFSGAGNFQDTLSKMTGPVFSSINEMFHDWQAQLLKSAYGLNAPELNIPGFSSIDTDVLEVWKKFYDTEFRKFFNAPQLGLTREHQEKIARFLDRYNILQSALAEFLSTLAGPLKQSQADFQEKLKELAKTGKSPTEVRQYYRIWLKILEGKYMILFQSPDYIRTLGNTLSASAEYNRAKKDLVNDMLAQFSIPSSDHMDAVYKELHDLKKRLRALEKAVTKP